VGDPQDLVRRGNSAYARGEYGKAAGLFEMAEEYTTDPGLVAFNKAVALQAEDKWDGAETHYWLCLGDAGEEIHRLFQKNPKKDLPAAVCAAAGPRLIPVLYNLGTCLLQHSEGTKAEWLEQAVVVFDHCARLAPSGSRLAADARHNLELARELLRLNPKPRKSDQSSSDQEDTQNKPNQRDNAGGDPGNSGPDSMQNQNGGDRTEQQPNPGDNPLATDERTPGKGNLATLPDTDELVSMSPEEVAAHLRQAVQRILGERREYQQQAAKSSSRDVLDW
jgi:hypothetical protein